MEKIGIFGCSGFARETADIAYALNLTPVFIAESDDALSTLGPSHEGMLESQLDSLPHLPLALGIGDNRVRSKIFHRYRHRVFSNLIHPSATFGFEQLAQLSEAQGLIICAGVRLTNNIKIGNGCILNLNTTIGHDCILEEFVNIAPSANISGNVHIKAGTWIGTNAAINQGSETNKLIIGEHTVIGSGSVVTKPCDANSVYAGVPAKKIK